jgi:hypothetical protein
MGKIKRVFTCITIDSKDELAYLGTRTGDIIEIDLQRCLFKRIGPAKRLFSLGINVISLLHTGDLIIGAGDGTIARIGSKDMLIKSEAQVMGAVTSISLTADSSHFFAGTSKATLKGSTTSPSQPATRNFLRLAPSTTSVSGTRTRAKNS